MSLNNIKNLLQQQNITWDSIQKYLNENNVDQATKDQVQSVFDSLDGNKDGKISSDEWGKADAILAKADANNDGLISEEELSGTQDGNLFKNAGENTTNTLLAAMKSSTQATNNMEEPTTKQPPSSADTSTKPDLSGYEFDKDGNLITYPKEGESFKKTAERLGFKPGTPEYDEFVKANPQAGKRNWFKVGDQVKVPPSIQDKVNKDGIIDKTQGQEEVEKWNDGYNTRINNAASQRPVRTSARGGQTSSVAANSYPKAIQERLEQLKKSGDKYEVIKNSNGSYTIKVTNGGYMKKNGIGEINMLYDANGNLQTYTQKYNNGKITETTYAGGKKTVTKANPAPQAYQDLAKQLQQQQGGNVRLEYNSKIKHWVLVQTNLKDENIKEIRTVVDEKSWQEKTSRTDSARQGATAAAESFINKAKKFQFGAAVSDAKSAAARYRNDGATLEDHFLSSSVQYTNGKKVQNIYNKGKISKTTTLREARTQKPAPTEGADAANSATTVKDRTRLNTATDITFNMPPNAPENAKTFANSLIENKERLMRELGIDSDTYNMLAQTAMGIAAQETNFGEQTARQTVKDVLRAPSDSIAWAQDKLGLENTSSTDWSQGITQLKYTLHCQDEWVKKHMTNLGITNELQLQDPETSAVATMVVLAKLNKEIDSKVYQDGIKTAQGISVSYPGYEMGPDGISRKSADGQTRPWTNEISRQDVLCAFWNGGARADVKNGTFKPQIWTYSKNVEKYTRTYKLEENQSSRAQAVETQEATRTFDDMNNNGEMGGVVFLPAMYTDKDKHMNTASEIQQLREILTKKGIDPNLRNQLISALQNGELGFDFGLRRSEIESLTNSDIKLLLKHLNKLKSQVNTGSINTSDGISAQEASQLRSKYASTVGNAEDNFREEYLNNHSATYNARATNPKVLRERSTNTGSSSYVGVNGQRRGFQHEKAKGVNVNTTAGQISNEAKLLAQSAHNVVAKNPNNNNSGYCLTGVKEAMSNAGIDVSGMSEYGSTPKYVKNWFAAHPEMFTPVEYVSTGAGTARAINASDLSNLPAGYIVIWEPESGGSYGDQAGHIAITNGNGQGYSDATDNLGWGTYSNNKTDSGKGEHGRFVVYKLSDNWQVDPSTGKLVLKS